MIPPQLSGAAPGGYAALVGDVLTGTLTVGAVGHAALAGATVSRKEAMDRKHAAGHKRRITCRIGLHSGQGGVGDLASRGRRIARPTARRRHALLWRSLMPPSSKQSPFNAASSLAPRSSHDLRDTAQVPHRQDEATRLTCSPARTQVAFPDRGAGPLAGMEGRIGLPIGSWCTARRAPGFSSPRVRKAPSGRSVCG